MKKIISFVAIICILATGLLSAPASATGAAFTDVRPNDWFAPYVQFVRHNGVMTGTSATTFAPLTTLSRAQVVATLFRIHHGRPAGARDPRTTPFTDVPTSNWFAPYISWASATGLVSGVGGNRFNPSGAVDRQQLATMLHRFARDLSDLDDRAFSGPQWARFADRGQIASWAYDALRWANHIGLVNGTTATTVSPTNTANRAELATLLTRFMRLDGRGVEPPPLPDPPPEPPNDAARQWELDVLHYTNVERARHGLQPLIWHEGLARLARAHSRDMYTRRFFAHTCPDGVTAWDRIRNAGYHPLGGAENLAMGNFVAARYVVAAWMNSPGHRANILMPELTHLGVGVYGLDFDHAPARWTQKFIGS